MVEHEESAFFEPDFPAEDALDFTFDIDIVKNRFFPFKVLNLFDKIRGSDLQVFSDFIVMLFRINGNLFDIFA